MLPIGIVLNYEVFQLL